MKAVKFILIAILVFLIGGQLYAGNWEDILKSAKGQIVYFNAWGGSDGINDYIHWAAEQAKRQYGITVKHVKVADIGSAVSRILAEKTAGRTAGGSVDLMWINGENFKAMKDNELLFGPFTQQLPNYRYVDFENKPTILYDFTTPVEHMEAPWGMAQLVFMIDTALSDKHPESMWELLEFARRYPGRVTYPAPPSFYGTTFVKQVLWELIDDPTILMQPVDKDRFEKSTVPLWEFLDQLHPLMWRGGKVFVSGVPEMKQLLNDSEIYISMSFNPNDASNAIANGELPDTVRTYIHKQGTIGNTHFVAIPFNSDAKEGAMVFANFLMSPEAQIRKAAPIVWGDPTVLAVGKLPQKYQDAFARIPIGKATLTATELEKVVLEPETSWVRALVEVWQKRYSR